MSPEFFQCMSSYRLCSKTHPWLINLPCVCILFTRPCHTCTTHHLRLYACQNCSHSNQHNFSKHAYSLQAQTTTTVSTGMKVTASTNQTALPPTPVRISSQLENKIALLKSKIQQKKLSKEAGVSPPPGVVGPVRESMVYLYDFVHVHAYRNKFHHDHHDIHAYRNKLCRDHHMLSTTVPLNI